MPRSFYGTKATTGVAIAKDAWNVGGMAKAPPIGGRLRWPPLEKEKQKQSWQSVKQGGVLGSKSNDFMQGSGRWWFEWGEKSGKKIRTRLRLNTLPPMVFRMKISQLLWCAFGRKALAISSIQSLISCGKTGETLFSLNGVKGKELNSLLTLILRRAQSNFLKKKILLFGSD